MKLRFSLRTLLLLVVVCAIGIAVPYWIPKSQTLTLHESHVGYYRGLGLTSGGGYFGKDWFRIVVDEGDEGFWEVDVDGLGDCPYRGYYPTGALREEGMCRVERNGEDIAPDRHQLVRGKFYSPDGILISEVENGTGKQVVCYANGNRSWELELVDGERLHLKEWFRNGQLAHEVHYHDGEPDGESVSYFRNGHVRIRAEYSKGSRTGVWEEYKEDGTLASTTSYTDD